MLTAAKRFAICDVFRPFLNDDHQIALLICCVELELSMFCQYALKRGLRLNDVKA